MQHLACHGRVVGWSTSAFTRSRLVVVAAKDTKKKSAAASKSSKGFGAPKPETVVLKDGCPCGSNKHYKVSCSAAANGP